VNRLRVRGSVRLNSVFELRRIRRLHVKEVMHLCLLSCALRFLSFLVTIFPFPQAPLEQMMLFPFFATLWNVSSIDDASQCAAYALPKLMLPRPDILVLGLGYQSQVGPRHCHVAAHYRSQRDFGRGGWIKS
jgi:hypothetical protein